MEQIERDATNACVDYVANNLHDVTLLLPKLISKSLIDRDDEDLIENEKTMRMKVKKVIQILYGKEGAFFALLEILIAEKKKFVAKHIYDEYKTRGGTMEVNLDEAEKDLSQTGWKVDSTVFKFSVMMPTGLNLANVSTWHSVKNMYLKRFQKTNPFSLPFTFDIDRTWVSLKLIEDSKDSQATEDYAELLKRAFLKEDMLIIEGKPATGKTCLMRRMAYDWAKGQKDLSHFDLIVYAEFREVRGEEFDSIVDLVIQYNINYANCADQEMKSTVNFIDREEFNNLKLLLFNKRYCKEQKNRVLLLLDGYDESSLDKQCKELNEYLSTSTLKNPLMFNIVITTRPGYLSKYRGNEGHYRNEGRFIFAEVLGFTTKEQKEKYISKHFLSIDNGAEMIKGVHYLLDSNENLNTLAEIPLFLTFICLVHKEIILGTILELYFNIIRWLIDRHQKAFSDRDIPALFEFQRESGDRFRIIQDNYLQFPQLHCLGKMALAKLDENIFQQSDITQFNLKPILEHVGLLRKDEFYKSLNLTTTFSFPHRTIQEFLSAFYYFISHENTDQQFPTNSEMNTDTMKEFDKFLLRIALSEQSKTLPMHAPINATTQKIYFERMKKITWLTLDLTFDAINTAAGLNSTLLNWFISQCTNLQTLNFSKPNEKKISVHNLLAFTNSLNLHSLTFNNCTFEADSQILFTNCPSLQNLRFSTCEIKSSASTDFSKLPALDSFEFNRCTVDSKAWQSITDKIRRSSAKQLKLTFEKDFNNEFINHLQKCNNVDEIEITFVDYIISKDNILSLNDLINLHSLKFMNSTFEDNSQISFANCPSLNILTFLDCEIESSASIAFSKLLALETLEFDQCTINLNARQSITDEITKSSVKQLNLGPGFFEKEENSEFFILLQKCECIEKMVISIWDDDTDEEQLTTNISNLAREMKGLKSIIFEIEGKRMTDTNMKIIEKAGQERDPNFKTIFGQETEEEYDFESESFEDSEEDSDIQKRDQEIEIKQGASRKRRPSCSAQREIEND